MPIPLGTLTDLFCAQVPLSIAILDRNFRYLQVTARWLEDYDLVGRELTGALHDELFPDAPADFQQICGRALAGQAQRCQPFRWPLSDGTARWMSWELQAWHDPAATAGQQTGVAIFSVRCASDTLPGTDRALATLLEEREALLRTERAYRKRLEALRQSALAISALDASLAEHTTELLQLIVEQARALTGADYGALGVGTDPQQVFDPWVVCGMSQQEIDAIERKPRPVGLLAQIACEHKVVRLADLHGAKGALGLPPNHPVLGPLLGVPILFRGRALGNFYLARRPGAHAFDHEDQAIVELLAGHAAIAIENARLYSRAYSDVRAREEVLAVVSHDLGNPLNAIALREQQLMRSGDAAVATHARHVSRSVEDMRRMIRGLLDVSRLDSGRLQLQREPVDVAELLKSVVDGSAPIASEREIAVFVDADVQAPVGMDRERMSQVLSNLVGNALKFTSAGGQITLRARQNAGELAISVADTGSGIAAEALPHVFDRYYTHGDGQRGTGLGLYIAKGFVEAHGGTIRLDSQLGAGTIVHLSLPIAAREQNEAHSDQR